jgi:hypothetical protein
MGWEKEAYFQLQRRKISDEYTGADFACPSIIIPYPLPGWRGKGKIKRRVVTFCTSFRQIPELAMEKEKLGIDPRERRTPQEGFPMHARITGHLRDLVQVVNHNPALKKILEDDGGDVSNPLLRDHLQTPAFLVGYDCLELFRKASKIKEENSCDLIKVRRRIEEHLRKYADDRTIIGLALFLGVPIK